MADQRNLNTQRYQQGLEIRKKVLGTAYVENAIAQADEFSKPLQQLVTEYCWGTIWADSTLSLQQRSMLNLAMITALNRTHELKLHVKGALRNGLSHEQIREVLLQAAIYCGVPAAVDSFRIARQAIEEFAQEELLEQGQ